MRVAVVGTGLIGGSIGLALARRGHEVVGFDRDADRRRARAKELGAVGEIAPTLDDAVARRRPRGRRGAGRPRRRGRRSQALDAGAPLVTDVGSVKAPVVAAVEAARPEPSARFVGGHPMAGSEQEGLDGADADLFVGATWVLTPTADTDAERVRRRCAALRRASSAPRSSTVTPEHHDALVAVVSHVPQLAASTLMDVATDARRGAPRRCCGSRPAASAT